MALVGTFDPKAVIVTWDGLRVEGFTTDGIATFEKLQESSRETGADGFTTITKPATLGRVATLTLYANSPGYKLLAETWNDEKAATGPVVEHTFQMEDVVSGDLVSDPAAVMLDGPVMDIGTTGGTRSFTILLPDPTERYGSEISG